MVDLLEVAGDYAGVYLRGGDVGVPEQFLNLDDVYAGVQQQCGGGRPDGVGGVERLPDCGAIR